MNTEWKLVPVEPVDEQQLAGAQAIRMDTTPLNKMFTANRVYRDMIAAAPPAPTSHPIPTGATGDRDWELACDECNGSGHVFVKHQVAERKTDVQEFEEECEACEGRGFNIAFEDIPGIAEYVKSCRPAPAAGDALDIERKLTAAVRETDSLFVKIGGSSRHWAVDCFLPTLRKHGLDIAAIAQQKGEA